MASVPSGCYENVRLRMLRGTGEFKSSITSSGLCVAISNADVEEQQLVGGSTCTGFSDCGIIGGRQAVLQYIAPSHHRCGVVGCVSNRVHVATGYGNRREPVM